MLLRAGLPMDVIEITPDANSPEQRAVPGWVEEDPAMAQQFWQQVHIPYTLTWGVYRWRDRGNIRLFC